MEGNLQDFLKQYDLTKKDIVDIKDERCNINIMTIAFKSIITGDNLGVEESLEGTCFVHVFFKARQYAIIEEKIYKKF